MNISYNWLKDLIEIDLAPELLAEKLTRVGLAVEGVHPHGDDYVFDIDLTSNRPDCLSHLGVARELRVITNLELRVKNHENQKPETVNHDLVTIEAPEICQRFTARVIDNVKIGPSPDWMIKRLDAIGERSINNVADITNYVMHELGQPMHSFDLDKLAGKRIVVRFAKPGETVKTLDEAERKLDASMLAICDAEKPVSIGGVMGGFDSGITGSTTTVLLEVAYFKRESIRQTSRKLGLATEASYRFERGVDIENIARASDRATALICELAGGKAGECVDIYPEKFVPNKISSENISHSVSRLTGLEVDVRECDRILNALGILRQDPQSPIYLSPSWRYDLSIEEDLVEEVARHTGYENISDELPPAYGAGEYQPTEPREKLLRQTLVDLGYNEAMTYSFIDTRHDGMFEPAPGVFETADEERYITLKDSVIEGAVRMRSSIIPGLLDSVRLNMNHRRRDLLLFEIGKVFSAGSNDSGLPNESELLTLVATGGELVAGRAMPVRELDFYDLKGAVETALAAVGFDLVDFRPADVKHLRPGQAAAVSINGKDVGYLGRLSDSISAGYKFRSPVFVAEIDLQTVFAITTHAEPYRPLPKYPSISRDVSFVADRSVSFAGIRDALVGQGVELLRSIEFVDVFEGKGMSESERSITVRLEYRSDAGTLIESETEALHGKIIAELERELGVRTRF
jgi:phenylalanyl-tRNA synthetase beta chain